MATSGKFYTSGYSDAGWPNCYEFSWTLVSQSIENNTSKISWSLKGYGGDNDERYTSVKEKYVTVNGVTKSNNEWQDTYNGTVAFSGETTINHSKDGTGAFSASAGGAFFYSGSYNSTGDGRWSLPTIARATTPALSATSLTMGNPITITINPAVYSFTHKIRYSFGNLTEQTAGFDQGLETGYMTAPGPHTIKLTPPTSLGSQIPSANSGTCTITLYTYNSSGTHIGTKTATFTLSVPNYTPSVSISISGNALLGGEYVQGKSTVEGNITASSQYEASISSISSVVDGKTYTGNPFTSEVLSSGNKSVVVTVKDSRGKTASATSAQFAVREYATPYITSVSAARQADGTTVVVALRGGVSSINGKNQVIYGVTLNGVTNRYTHPSSLPIDATTTFNDVPTDKTLEVKAEIKDSYNTATKTATLPTVAVTMDFYKDGKGIAMGKVAETSGLLDVAWDVSAGGNLAVKKNADVAGDLSVGGAFTLGGVDLLNHAKTEFGWGKNTVLYKADTVANSYGKTITGASVTLEANSTYLVLVGVMASNNDQSAYSDILLANAETGGEILISCAGRGGAYAGGGICGFAIVKTTSSTFARCQSHGYKNATFNLYMRTVAIKLDT